VHLVSRDSNYFSDISQKLFIKFVAGRTVMFQPGAERKAPRVSVEAKGHYMGPGRPPMASVTGCVCVVSNVSQ